jgi:hypothetical protein
VERRSSHGDRTRSNPEVDAAGHTGVGPGPGAAAGGELQIAALALVALVVLWSRPTSALTILPNPVPLDSNGIVGFSSSTS